MSKVKSQYTSNDIDLLTEREHVRLRTDMFLGSMVREEFVMLDLLAPSLQIKPVSFVPAAYKAVGEIIENSVDEFTQLPASRSKVLTLTADTETGKYTVADNGRGIPVTKHATGKYTPEVVYTMMRSGRNFKDDERIKGTKGVNGVGSCSTVATCEYFSIDITRDGKKYAQEFINGAETISKPKIISTTSKRTGTSVSFQLDKTVFKDVAIPESVLANRAAETAFANPGVEVRYHDQVFKAKRGFLDYVDRLDLPYMHVVVEDAIVTGEAFVIMLPPDHVCADKAFAWVDGSYVFDGGKCNTQFVNAIVERFTNHFQSKQKGLTVIPPALIKNRIAVLLNLKLISPKYDSQAKTRLTGPDLRRQFDTALDGHWDTLKQKHRVWLTATQADIAAAATNNANRNATSEFEKKKKQIAPIANLLEATSKHRKECQLIVTEGLSAKASISEARDPKTTAAFALTGKINNTFGKSVAQLLQMPKVADLITAIGVVPGKAAIRTQLNYGRVMFATDSDVDGGDIFALLVNVFFQYWPELFDPKQPAFFYRLVAPNVCLIKGDQRIHFSSLAIFEKQKAKYSKGYSINYYKGLGSMDKADWLMVLANDSTVIPITDDGKLTDLLELLFSGNAENRRTWLSTESTIPTPPKTSTQYVEQQRREYSLYTLMSRALPAIADGLKPAGRRAIWKARDGKKIKVAALSGACMSIHPHGENSDAINTLTATYGTNFPLFTGYGAFGTLLDSTAYGAPRYTSVCLSEFSNDAMLVDMDLVPMVDNYDCTEKEPEHFLPLIPMPLVNPIEGIAVGYATNILPRSLDDLITAQILILKQKKPTECIPQFTPTHSHCVKQELINGKQVFYFEGEWVRMSTRKVRITRLPYGLQHADFIAKLVVEADEEGSPLASWIDGSKDVLDIVVSFDRAVTDEQVTAILGLTNRHFENLNVLNFSGDSVLSTNATELIAEFTKWRVTWYKKRYQLMIDKVSASVQRRIDIETAIKGQINKFASSASTKQVIKQKLVDLGVVNVDYVSDLPLYRFTEEERAANLAAIAKEQKTLAEYTDVLNTNSKLISAYIFDLTALRTNLRAGKYDA